MKTFIVEARTQNEFDSPIGAKIEVTDTLIGLIKQRQKLVKKHGLYCTEEFDYTPQWLEKVPEEDDEEEVESLDSFECTCLRVTNSYFEWTTLYKGTDTSVTTTAIEISKLDN